MYCNHNFHSCIVLALYVKDFIFTSGHYFMLLYSGVPYFHLTFCWLDLLSNWCSSCRLTASVIFEFVCAWDCLLPLYLNYKLDGYKTLGSHFHFLRTLWVLLNLPPDINKAVETALCHTDGRRILFLSVTFSNWLENSSVSMNLHQFFCFCFCFSLERSVHFQFYLLFFLLLVKLS